MKISKISLLIFVFVVYGCVPTKTNFTPTQTKTLPSTITPAPFPTSTPTIQSKGLASEIRVISRDKQIDIVGFDENVFSVTWSKDGKSLLIEPKNSNLYIFDFENETIVINPVEKLPTKDVYSLKGQSVLTHDGKTLIVIEPFEITIWDIASNKKIKELFKVDSELQKRGPQFHISGIALSPDGKSLIAGHSTDFSDKKTFMVWDTSTWKLQRTFSGGNLGSDFAVVFSPDGKRFTTSGGSGIHEPSIWDFNSGKMLFSLGAQSWVYAIAYNPSGKYFAIGGTGGGNIDEQVVTIYDANSGKIVRKLNAVGFATHILAFSPDGTKLAAGGGSDRPGEVIIWDLTQQ